MRIEATIGRRVRRAREQKGWKQTDLVNALSERGLPMSVPTLLRLEKGPRNGGRSISVQEWLTLAAVLEVPPLLLLLPLGEADEVEVTTKLRMHPHLAVDWIVGDTAPGHNPTGKRTAPFVVGSPGNYAAAAEPLRAWRSLREAQSDFMGALTNLRLADQAIDQPLPSRSTPEHRKAAMERRQQAWDEIMDVAPTFREAILRIRSHDMRPPAYSAVVIDTMAAALRTTPDDIIGELGLELLDGEEGDVQ